MVYDANLIGGVLGNKYDISILDEVDSTSTLVRESLKNSSDPSKNFLCVANNQIAGRGRQGRSFVCSSGKGIYVSFSIDINSSFEEVVSLTTFDAVCVVDSIRRLTGKNVGIKWINDIYLDGRKICGILTECISEAGFLKKAIIGIGINLYPFDVEEELSNIVGFLEPTEDIRNELLIDFVTDITEFSRGSSSNNELIRKAEDYSIVLGKQILFNINGISYSGLAKSINSDGSLVVDCDGKNEVLRSGEISLKVVSNEK